MDHMKKFRIQFEMDRCCGSLILEANSADEAESEFTTLSPDDVMEMSGLVPEFEVEEVDEE
ncbi:MAG: hypothetical protein H6Q70_129 [Firmicutes bacterium]|nr:hypothetical protein [Ignavibacteriaceae bacterium]MBP2629501.1 hypothetical protein [Bacillota bacterium]